MSHRRCAGWLGGRAEFLVEAISAALDGWEERLSFLWPEGDGWGIIAALDG